MSQKSARRSAATSSSQHHQSATEMPSSSSNIQSPITPTRMSRIQEKHQLANLNDRLAAYIEKNQQLEQENSQLTLMNQKSEETLSRNISRVTTTYEKELIDTRRMIDETAKGRAKLQIENSQLKKDLDETKSKLDKKVKEETALLKRVTALENQMDAQGRQLKIAQDDKNKLAAANKEHEAELHSLRKQLEEMRKAHESEVLQRIDLENQLKTKVEEINFKTQIFEEEKQEIRLQKQVEVQAVDAQAKQDYETKLQESIQELRREFEGQLEANKNDMDGHYEQKVQDLKAQLKRVNTTAISKAEELETVKSRVDALVANVNRLDSERLTLQTKIKELEKKLSDDHNKFAKMLDTRDQEIDTLVGEKEAMMNDYQLLMDTKVALANEIATYRKLLEGEERRLSLSPKQELMLLRSGTPSGGRGTPLRPIKRKRGGIFTLDDAYESSFEFQSESGATGEVEIIEDEPEGKYIRLQNKGDKEISLAGWTLIRRANEQETKHKFHRSTKMEANGTMTIWSSDTAGSVHEPPTSIILKGLKWFTGDEINTTLSNNSGEEVATRNTKKVVVSHQRKRFGALSPEELFHQEPDAQGDRCTIV